MEHYYTAKELAKRLSVTQETIWRWGREGKLKTMKFGRTARYAMPRRERSNGQA